MRFPSIIREVPEGGEIPRGFGIAWYQPGRPVATVLPVPINLIAGLLRVLWWRIQCPPWRFYGWRLQYMKELGYGIGWEAHSGFPLPTKEIQRRLNDRSD